MTTYPPERHLLRDLCLSFDNPGGESRAWLPVVPEVCGDDGAVRAGALTTLVDVIGGGLAASTASPDWIATADLTLHMTAPVNAGTVEARAEVLRAGRSTVVLEVGLYADAGNSVGTATMSFSVLPRRDSNPDIGATRPAGPSTMAVDGSSLDAPLFDLVGIETVDAARGVVEVPVRTWATNSMGALQG
ncbi:MAG: PaaI family thioesterase, partial [Acidimicrobiia bacterium]